MKNIDDLMHSAVELAERGLSKGEIADELNVSRETASWLVERSEASPGGTSAALDGPEDIHVDWNAIGKSADRLSHVCAAMADLLPEDAVDLTVGIEKAGVPLATTISQRLGTDLGTYAPRKHQWNDSDMADLDGAFSRNFAQMEGQRCYVVDDTITTGTTMTESIESIRQEGAEPVACVVLVDKKGTDEIAGVPVRSLVQVIRVGDDE
ncbi:orotate phosphoribosyltransferase-like protein [Halovenus sp. WSH3]|uniref:Transcriptional regulator GfcR n=1 Tax=Halovenus carboxidivorans TaxID=2692199 RepID=A0A6B0TAH1_9EURY|nr:transcriptional regulator GfcR [Halovenus carboxidivorans]MXR53176.1 orotate phosphoribosyltransferase-like protein [Halovenus carboxidivorans]